MVPTPAHARLRRRSAFSPSPHRLIREQSLPSPDPSDPDVPSSGSESDYGEWRGRRTRSACGGSATWVCDEAELERQAAEHWMFRMLLGWPYWGPTHEILREDRGRWKRVLDVGTGCGVWAIDMAELFPEVEVVGTAPENCE
ncbi:hypothetical protein Q5752_003161 [Cryptotrichosporon argae]